MSKNAEREAHTPRYPRLQSFDPPLLTPEAYAAYLQDRSDSKRRWIALFLGRRYQAVECNLSNPEEQAVSHQGQPES
jgi:hypothetical protein